MNTVTIGFYQFRVSKTLIATLGAILAVLAFAVFVETSYFRWHSSLLILTKFLVMAFICNFGVFFSLSGFGRRHKILSLLPLLFSLISVPLIVGYFHTAVAIASVAIILVAIVELFRE
jgi:hypothetical protein